MSELTPVAPRERLVTLDVLRGFALFGVMIGNMVLYSGQWAEQRPASHLPMIDEIADWLLMIFVRSKAQTLLTFLFGFGFAVQLLRAEERREPVMGLYVRRLVVLFALGALHVSLLWWGDVVWTYAVSGFGLLAFLRVSNRTRVLWALALIFLPNIVLAIPELRLAAVPAFLEPRAFEAHTARMAAALHRSDRAGLAWEHLRYACLFCSRLWFWYFPWTLGRFLLGYVAGKLRWFDRNGADHLPVFRRLAACGVAAAMVTTSLDILQWLHVLPPLYEYGVWGRLGSATAHEIGSLALTLAYVGIVVLLMQRAVWRRVLRVLAPAGRMPLTTYFSQSLVCTFIFYGWGLGWAGSVGVGGTLGLALAIFGAQLALCHLWLRFFALGPLEWVWRTAVYLKPQPMRV